MLAERMLPHVQQTGKPAWHGQCPLPVTWFWVYLEFDACVFYGLCEGGFRESEAAAELGAISSR